MSGIVALSKIQMGPETTAGTAVACTFLFRGYGVLDDQQESIFPEERIGIFSGTDRSYLPSYLVGVSFDANEATFEMFPHVLEASIETHASGSQDGSGSGYIRQYNLPETQAPSRRTYTIRGGDNQQAELVTYCFVDSWTLEGRSREAWMLSSEWMGQQATTTSFTAGLTVPDVNEMLFQQTKFYIDDVSGSFGGTQITNNLLSARIEYDSGLLPKFTADGQLYFSFVQTTTPEMRVTVRMEHDATAVAEKANWKANTARLIRFLIEGETLTTAGTTYSRKTCIIDLAGKWETFEPLDDEDGNMVQEATFLSRYNDTKADWGSVTVVNELSVLP